MTELLKRVIAEIAALPPADQDAIATRLLAELEDERKWSKSFSESKEALKRLAEEARADHKAGRTIPGDW